MEIFYLESFATHCSLFLDLLTLKFERKLNVLIEVKGKESKLHISLKQFNSKKMIGKYTNYMNDNM